MKNQLRMPGCLLAASVLVMALAGCGHRLDGQQASGFVEPVKTYEQRHPIEIEKARAVLALSVPANAHGLNVYQKERVRHFIALWRNEGAGKIAIAGNNREALGDLRDLLIERVVPVGAVQVIGYDAGQPGLKLSFARYVAEGPKCGKFPTNLAIDPGNTEYENFGCAGQHNFAAMIANPHDLVSPRDQVDWTDADRRNFIFRAFEAGRSTAGDTTATDKAGTISDVAKH